MGVPAYKALIKSSGTPTAMLQEPMTEISDGVFIITSVNKRVLSLEHPYTIQRSSNQSPISPGSITAADLISGTFTIPDAEGMGLEINATYIPVSEIIGANKYSLDIGGDILDDTNFLEARVNGGFRTKVYGIFDVTVSIDRNSDYGQKFIDYKRNRERVFIEIRPGADTQSEFAGVYRGWFFAESTGLAGDIGDLETESIKFNLAGSNLANFCFVQNEPII